MNTSVMFSSKSDNWATPKDFYDKLNHEFGFDFDPCPLNAQHDALSLSFTWKGKCFINPPYSNIKRFLEKGLQELEKGNVGLLVYLVPARTDTKWFHDFVYNKAEIRFIKGRLKFGEGKNSAPFPSMLVIFRKKVVAMPIDDKVAESKCHDRCENKDLYCQHCVDGSKFYEVRSNG